MQKETMEQLVGEKFSVYHAMVCACGSLSLSVTSLFVMSGLYANLLPFNCSSGNASLGSAAAQGQLTSLSSQYQLCDQALGDLTTLFFFVGMAAGSVCAGPLSDLVGRVPTIVVGVATASASGLAGNYCPQFWQHLAARCVCGCGVMMQQCSVQVYGNEVHTQRHRGKFNSAWMFGIAVACAASGGLAFVTKRHQLYMLISSILSLVVLLAATWLPESPLWLAAKGQVPRAGRSLRRIAAVNRRSPPSPSDVQRLAASAGHGDEKQRRLSLLESLRRLRPRDAMNLCVILPYGFCVTSTAYGFAFVVSKVVSNVYAFIALQSLVMLPTAAVMNVWPRPLALFASGLAAGLLCLGVSALTFWWPEASGPAAWAALGVGLGGSFFSSCGFSVAVTTGAELFPTAVRNTCLGLLYLVTRLGCLVPPALTFVPHVTVRILVLALPLLAACWPALLLPDSRQMQLHGQPGGGDANGDEKPESREPETI